MASVQQLWRPSVTLVALFAVGYLGIFGYARATRTAGDDAPEPQARAASSSATSGNTSATEDARRLKAAPAVAEASAIGGAVPATVVAKWVVDATGDDPKARAKAIAALAKAPRADAVPVLQRVLISGDPQVDRPLALRSLRTLALEQGDADQSIRNALRQAIYHGDDDASVHGAQSTLDDVEHALTRAP